MRNVGRDCDAARVKVAGGSHAGGDDGLVDAIPRNQECTWPNSNCIFQDIARQWLKEHKLFSEEGVATSQIRLVSH